MDNIKYRIRKRTSNAGTQYYVDYKRLKEGETLDDTQWMGGFYAETEEKAKEIVARHREYEELRLRLQMDEEVIYDETEEKSND